MSARVSEASTAASSTSSASSSASNTSSSLSHVAAVPPRLPRGTIIAYLSIVVASILGLLHLIPVYPHMMILTIATIYIGSHNSLVTHSHDSSSVTETMQTRDALLFPLIGSVVLFSLYIVFKVFPKEYVNVLIKAYFFVFGCIVLSHKLHSLLQHTLPPSLVTSLSATSFTITNPLTIWPLTYLAAKDEPTKPTHAAAEGEDRKDDKKKSDTAAEANAASSEDDRIPVTPLYAIATSLALLVALYYLYSNNWLCSNLFAIAFSIQGIELLSLGSYLNGAILLAGLFIYDIFWVFGTEVMVTVAKSFDAPIKLLFPQTSWEERPSMLGLGDIVIPGIFIALMLRYDYFHYQSRESGATKPAATVVRAKPHLHIQSPSTAPPAAPRSTPFFDVVLVSYFIGLSVTVAVMYYFKAAQPALLYLVPACLGSSVAVAWYHGEVMQMFRYTEGEAVTVEDKKD